MVAPSACPEGERVKKKRTYGGIACDEFGYVLLRAPNDHFGGYMWTFPNGVPNPGHGERTWMGIALRLASVHTVQGADAKAAGASRTMESVH